jgi:hypothetical protein
MKLSQFIKRHSRKILVAFWLCWLSVMLTFVLGNFLERDRTEALMVFTGVGISLAAVVGIGLITRFATKGMEEKLNRPTNIKR